jgi:drug/metabolite transporter (DMT)-like permease
MNYLNLLLKGSVSAKKIQPHVVAILQAVFVTFLWSTSWVLIKIGLKSHLPPITFAGLRYTIAFIVLLPFVLYKKEERRSFKNLSAGDWKKLALLGIIFYTLTQGTQFLSLAFLPAAMVSMLLNLTPVIVALSGIILLNERPAPVQWGGVIIASAGIAVYFLPANLPDAQIWGLAVALLCVLSNTGSALLGRYVNHQSSLSPLLITFVSMGIGAVLLLIGGLVFQGMGTLSLLDWSIIIWLAVVNTAWAFTLWNKSLKVLTAVESSILNSLMLPQIAILAVVFLGEGLTAKQIAGLVFVSFGVLLVQMKKKQSTVK